MDRCQFCGRHPAKWMSFSAHQGFVIFRRHITIEGMFCRDCALAAYAQARGMTLKGMWFSPGSLVMGTLGSLWDSAKLLDLPPEVEDEPWMPHKVGCPKCGHAHNSPAGEIDCGKCRSHILVVSCQHCGAVHAIAAERPLDTIDLSCRSCGRTSEQPTPARNCASLLFPRGVAEVAARIGVSPKEFDHWCQELSEESQLQPRTWTWISGYQRSQADSGEVLQSTVQKEQSRFLAMVLLVCRRLATAEHCVRLRELAESMGFDPDRLFEDTAESRPCGAEQVDWRITLDVGPDATLKDVESAYRRLARDSHPDYRQNAGSEEQEHAREKMKDLNRAIAEARRHFACADEQQQQAERTTREREAADRQAHARAEAAERQRREQEATAEREVKERREREAAQRDRRERASPATQPVVASRANTVPETSHRPSMAGAWLAIVLSVMVLVGVFATLYYVSHPARLHPIADPGKTPSTENPTIRTTGSENRNVSASFTVREKDERGLAVPGACVSLWYRSSPNSRSVKLGEAVSDSAGVALIDVTLTAEQQVRGEYRASVKCDEERVYLPLTTFPTVTDFTAYVPRRFSQSKPSVSGQIPASVDSGKQPIVVGKVVAVGDAYSDICEIHFNSAVDFVRGQKIKLYRGSREIGVFRVTETQGGALFAQNASVRARIGDIAYPVSESDTVEVRGAKLGNPNVDLGALNDVGGFLEVLNNSQQLIDQKCQYEVDLAIKGAFQKLPYDSCGALADLKLTLEFVDRNVDMSPEMKRQLRERVLSAIREAARQAKRR